MKKTANSDRSRSESGSRLESSFLPWRPRSSNHSKNRSPQLAYPSLYLRLSPFGRSLPCFSCIHPIASPYFQRHKESSDDRCGGWSGSGSG